MASAIPINSRIACEQRAVSGVTNTGKSMGTSFNFDAVATWHPAEHDRHGIARRYRRRSQYPLATGDGPRR